MKVLLFGKGGQVGGELQRSLAPLGEVAEENQLARRHWPDNAHLLVTLECGKLSCIRLV
ncbi:MAG: hypothetical protein H6R17_309 [Proteobacteria bacterium]|nr:hypothetical protein [Pseudomonadota bacterium]